MKKQLVYDKKGCNNKENTSHLQMSKDTDRKKYNKTIDFFRNSEMESSSRRTTGEDRSLLRVNEDRSQAFNNEID